MRRRHALSSLTLTTARLGMSPNGTCRVKGKSGETLVFPPGYVDGSGCPRSAHVPVFVTRRKEAALAAQRSNWGGLQLAPIGKSGQIEKREDRERVGKDCPVLHLFTRSPSQRAQQLRCSGPFLTSGCQVVKISCHSPSSTMAMPWIKTHGACPGYSRKGR